MKTTVHSALLLALTAGVFTSSAHAVYVTEATANAHLGGNCCNPYDFVTGSIGDPGSVDFERVSTDSGESAAAATVIRQVLDDTRPSGLLFRAQSLGNAFASAGVLRAEAFAGYFADGYTTGDSVSARAVALFDDTITLSGVGSRIDTNVDFRVSGGLGLGAAAFGEVQVNNRTVIRYRNEMPLSPGEYACLQPDGLFTACSGFVTVNLPNGVPFQLKSVLAVVASASGLRGRGDAAADFSETGLTYLSFDNPAFSFVADSGYHYTAPVPEPDTWTMLLAGVAGVGIMTARRRKARA